MTHLHASYLRRSRYVLGLHAATLIVGCSDAVISGALADGVAPSRVRVIPNGLDFSRLNEAATDLRATLRIPVESQVIASVGSLKQLKGHDIVINAFRSLPGEPHLILAGSGEEERNLRQQAEVLGIAKRVHFIGETKNTGSVYRAADIFALGTRNEAFGLVLAEAGYFGLPSVSTKVGGIPHVVLNGHTGLLVTSNDTTQFQVALATLAADPALRRRMGAAATRHVEQHFSAPRMAREFEGIYAQLAETPRHRLGWRQAVRNVARPYSKLAPFVERVAR